MTTVSTPPADLRYPIGDFAVPARTITDADRRAAIDAIAALPAELRAAVAGLDDARLDTPYRPGGWTVRQVVHHVPDSHMNGYVRTKLALTEPTPTIKPYEEGLWAQLPDTRLTPPEVSLSLLDAVHARWVTLLRRLEPAQFARTYIHPVNGERSLDQHVALYAWHGRHHTAHVLRLREREGW